MAAESTNGATPAGEDAPEPDAAAEFSRFEDLMRHLISVPKAEIDKRLAAKRKPIKSR